MSKEQKLNAEFGKELLDNIAFSDGFNKGDEPPFGLFNPDLEGKLVWICSTDDKTNIVSVFRMHGDGIDEKQCSYITIEESIKTRDCLLENGWLPIKPPTVSFTYPGIGNRPIDRKEKKKIKKCVNNMMKKNPFTQK